MNTVRIIPVLFAATLLASCWQSHERYPQDGVADTTSDTAPDTTADVPPDTTGTHYVWTEYFDGTDNTPGCDSWNAYRAGLATSGYGHLNVRGTYDTVGLTCDDPVAVMQIADALRTGADAHIMCAGTSWSLCDWGTQEFWIGAPYLCDSSNCPNPGYMVRPCFSVSNVWSGVNSDTCIGPEVTVTVDFW